MKQTVNRSQFSDAFRDMGRADQFSYAGLTALYGYLNELESDTGEELELDVIAICCDYSEIDLADIESETGCETLDELRDKTTVIEVDDETIIYGAF